MSANSAVTLVRIAVEVECVGAGRKRFECNSPSLVTFIDALSGRERVSCPRLGFLFNFLCIAQSAEKSSTSCCQAKRVRA